MSKYFIYPKLFYLLYNLLTLSTHLTIKSLNIYKRIFTSWMPLILDSMQGIYPSREEGTIVDQINGFALGGMKIDVSAYSGKTIMSAF